MNQIFLAIQVHLRAIRISNDKLAPGGLSFSLEPRDILTTTKEKGRDLKSQFPEHRKRLSPYFAARCLSKQDFMQIRFNFLFILLLMNMKRISSLCSQSMFLLLCTFLPEELLSFFFFFKTNFISLTQKQRAIEMAQW